MKTQKPKKKILLLITKSNWGGAQRYIFDVANYLPRDRFDVTLVFGGHAELEMHAHTAGIRTISLSSLTRDTSPLTDTKAFREIWQLLKTEQPDIVHTTSSKAGLLGTVIARLQGVPRVIFTSCAWAFNEDRPVHQKFLIKTLHWITVLASHKTAVISRSLKEQMNWPFVQDKMVLTHLARKIPDLYSKDIARGILANHPSQATTNLAKYQADFWLGTIAELHPIKRLNIALRALAETITTHPRLRFIIIHEGSERPKLEALRDELDLQEHVFFMGLIPDAARLIPAFDLFTLPSKSEAFGYVLVEAGMAGVPVVATNVGGIPDIVTAGETGILVPPDDVSALAAGWRNMIENPEERARYAEAHHQRCQNFTIETMMEKTIALYSVE